MQQYVSPSVAAAANPAVYGSVPGGAALMMYGLGTNAAGAKPAENIPVSKNKLHQNCNPTKHLYILARSSGYR